MTIRMTTRKYDPSTVIGRQIARRITRQNLSASPSIYAVLYAHYSGRNPDISYAINTMDREQTALTTQLCENLYETYIAQNSPRVLIEKARLQETLFAQ